MHPAGAAADQTYELIRDGKYAEALELITPLAAATGASHSLLAAYAAALKSMNRMEDALVVEERAVRLFPASAVAWHNLAATCDAMGRYDEAGKALDTAFALGLDGPETWLVKAHLSMNRMEFEPAIAAFQEVLKRSPAFSVAAQELAKITWMTTGDWQATVAPLRSARAAGATEIDLYLFEAKVLEAAGEREALHRLFGDLLRKQPDEAAFVRAAAHAWLEDDDLDRASALVEHAVRLAPQSVSVLVEFAAVRLAQGRAQEAFEAARRATQVSPLDQSTWGWLATTGRAMGHPVFEALHDYANLVRPYTLETPPGWRSLEAFLADLETTLRDMHRSSVHPADQSLRQGTQTNVDLAKSDRPVLKAFFAALDAPIRDYMQAVGPGADPLRSRVTGDYRIESAWSVLLRPNGFHVSHYHPMGWISSAFYVRTPDSALGSESREGWIKFGEPPFKTAPPQPPAHFVRPEPGRLVLFPSYMWHGTVPFTTPESRLTIAFDVLPV